MSNNSSEMKEVNNRGTSAALASGNKGKNSSNGASGVFNIIASDGEKVSKIRRSARRLREKVACDVCGKELLNPESKVHTRSKFHQKALAKQNGEVVEEEPKAKAKPKGKRPCGVCGKELLNPEGKVHTRSKFHQKALAKQGGEVEEVEEPKPKPKGDKVPCDVCGKQLKNPKSKVHIRSKFHQKALEKQEERSTEDEEEEKQGAVKPKVVFLDEYEDDTDKLLDFNKQMRTQNISEARVGIRFIKKAIATGGMIIESEKEFKIQRIVSYIIKIGWARYVSKTIIKLIAKHRYGKKLSKEEVVHVAKALIKRENEKEAEGKLPQDWCDFTASIKKPEEEQKLELLQEPDLTCNASREIPRLEREPVEGVEQVKVQEFTESKGFQGDYTIQRVIPSDICVTCHMRKKGKNHEESTAHILAIEEGPTFQDFGTRDVRINKEDWDTFEVKPCSECFGEDKLDAKHKRRCHKDLPIKSWNKLKKAMKKFKDSGRLYEICELVEPEHEKHLPSLEIEVIQKEEPKPEPKKYKVPAKRKRRLLPHKVETVATWEEERRQEKRRIEPEIIKRRIEPELIQEPSRDYYPDDPIEFEDDDDFEAEEPQETKEPCNPDKKDTKILPKFAEPDSDDEEMRYMFKSKPEPKTKVPGFTFGGYLEDEKPKDEKPKDQFFETLKNMKAAAEPKQERKYEDDEDKDGAAVAINPRAPIEELQVELIHRSSPLPKDVSREVQDYVGDHEYKIDKEVAQIQKHVTQLHQNTKDLSAISDGEVMLAHTIDKIPSERAKERKQVKRQLLAALTGVTVGVIYGCYETPSIRTGITVGVLYNFYETPAVRTGVSKAVEYKFEELLPVYGPEQDTRIMKFEESEEDDMDDLMNDLMNTEYPDKSEIMDLQAELITNVTGIPKDLTQLITEYEDVRRYDNQIGFIKMCDRDIEEMQDEVNELEQMGVDIDFEEQEIIELGQQNLEDKEREREELIRGCNVMFMEYKQALEDTQDNKPDLDQPAQMEELSQVSWMERKSDTQEYYDKAALYDSNASLPASEKVSEPEFGRGGQDPEGMYLDEELDDLEFDVIVDSGIEFSNNNSRETQIEEVDPEGCFFEDIPIGDLDLAVDGKVMGGPARPPKQILDKLFMEVGMSVESTAEPIHLYRGEEIERDVTRSILDYRIPRGGTKLAVVYEFTESPPQDQQAPDEMKGAGKPKDDKDDKDKDDNKSESGRSSNSGASSTMTGKGKGSDSERDDTKISLTDITRKVEGKLIRIFNDYVLDNLEETIPRRRRGMDFYSASSRLNQYKDIFTLDFMTQRLREQIRENDEEFYKDLRAISIRFGSANKGVFDESDVKALPDGLRQDVSRLITTERVWFNDVNEAFEYKRGDKRKKERMKEKKIKESKKDMLKASIARSKKDRLKANEHDDIKRLQFEYDFRRQKPIHDIYNKILDEEKEGKLEVHINVTLSDSKVNFLEPTDEIDDKGRCGFVNEDEFNQFYEGIRRDLLDTFIVDQSVKVFIKYISDGILRKVKYNRFLQNLVHTGEEQTESDKQNEYNVKMSGNFVIEVTFNLGRNSRRGGAFWPYLNKTDLDLTRLGIYKELPEEFKDVCFIESLQELGYEDEEKLNLIRVELRRDRITRKKLEEYAKTLNITIALHSELKIHDRKNRYNKFKETQYINPGKEEYNIVETENHYMPLIKFDTISKTYLRGYESMGLKGGKTNIYKDSYSKKFTYPKDLSKTMKYIKESGNYEPRDERANTKDIINFLFANKDTQKMIDPNLVEFKNNYINDERYYITLSIEDKNCRSIDKSGTILYNKKRNKIFQRAKDQKDLDKKLQSLDKRSLVDNEGKRYVIPSAIYKSKYRDLYSQNSEVKFGTSLELRREFIKKKASIEQFKKYKTKDDKWYYERLDWKYLNNPYYKQYRVIYLDLESGFEKYTDENGIEKDKHIPYCVCYVTDEGKVHQFKGKDCITECLKSLKGRYLIYCHNVKYEIQFMMQHLSKLPESFMEDYSFSIIEGDGQVYQLRGFYLNEETTYASELVFKDSYKLISKPLRDFGKMFDLDVSKDICPYELYRIENIYTNKASISEALKYISKDDQEQFMKNVEQYRTGPDEFRHVDYSVDYCIKDCLVTKAGIEKFREMVYEVTLQDIHDRLTIASVAHAYMIDSGVYEGCYSLNSVPRYFIQECVVGGRVMCRDNKKQDIKGKIQDFDAVSLYPSAMNRIGKQLGGYLKGKPKVLQQHQLNKKTLDTFDGYFIKIKIKKCGIERHMPLCSVKDKKSGVRNFTNVKNEYVFVDKVGFEDLIQFQKIEYEIVQGYYYNEGRNKKIEDTIQHLFNERKAKKAEIYINKKGEKTKGNPIQEVYKLMMNSGYGKTIQRARETETKIVETKVLNRYLCENWFDIKESYSLNDSKYTIVIKYQSINLHFALPQVGCEVLSMSKRIMNEVICTAEDMGYPVYITDTDSMHLRDEQIPRLAKEFSRRYGCALIGKNLGQFHSDFDSSKGSVSHSRRLIALGKKCYIDELVVKTKDNKEEIDYHIRMKGVSHSAIWDCAESRFNNEVIKVYETLYKGDPLLFNLCAKRVRFEFKKGLGVSSLKKFERTLKFE